MSIFDLIRLLLKLFVFGDNFVFILTVEYSDASVIILGRLGGAFTLLLCGADTSKN